MFDKLVNYFSLMAHSRWYWVAFIIGGVLTLAVALYYQYALQEWPCVLCIHIRLWISLLIVVAVIGVIVSKYRVPNILAHIFSVIAAIALTERSYILLGTEKGFVFGDCGFDAGLPAWFAIDKWLPSIYGVESSCGYTPELVFGITMAEGLMIMSIGLLLLCTVVTIMSIIKRRVT